MSVPPAVHCFSTSFGRCGVAWSEKGCSKFQLPEDPAESGGEGSMTNEIEEPPSATWINDLIHRVRRHLEGVSQDFSDVPLDWSLVSDFQQQVYRKTQDIRPGQTTSYGAIARALGLGPAGARAVGVALATNPWPLLVPCHRVVAANGRMTGFSAPGGIRTKTRLLALEGAELLSE